VRLSAIFNHFKTMRLSQCHDRVHIAGPTSQMHADHGFGTRRQYLDNGGGRQVAAVELHIGKHRRRACIDHARHAGNKGARRYYHFVARANTQCLQRHIKRQGAVTQRDRVTSAAPGGELFFKFATLGARPVIDFIGQQHLLHGVCLFSGKTGPRRKTGIQHFTFQKVSFRA